MHKLLGLALLAALPAFPIAVTTVDAEWSVTKIATNEVLCSGAATSNFMGTVCDSIAELPGFGITLSIQGSANTFNTSAFADTDIQAGVNFPIDASLYEIQFDAEVNALATNLVAILGGTGSGLFQGFVDSGSGVTPSSGANASAEAQVHTGCISGDAGSCPLQTFNFAEAFLVTASAQAHVVSIPSSGVGATSNAGAGIVTGQIFDLNLNPLPGAFAVAVPEPSSLALVLVPALLLIWASKSGIKFGVLPTRKLVSINRSAR